MDGLQQLGIEGAEGVESTEVTDEPVAKNVLIGVGGVVLVIAAMIPITYAVLTVAYYVIGIVGGFLIGSAAAEL
ncbi:MAG TPA: hypothetical protein VIP55_03760 [Agromyces sp.]